MKFEASFTGPDLFGRGTIHLLETGLVLEGWRPKFSIGKLNLAQEVFSEPSVLTIPYGRIRDYQRPGFLRRVHQVKYMSPNKEVTLMFGVPGKNEALAQALQEFIELAKTVQLGG